MKAFGTHLYKHNFLQIYSMDWNRFFARLCLFLFACHHPALAAYSKLKDLDDISNSDHPYHPLSAGSTGESSSSTPNTKSSFTGLFKKKLTIFNKSPKEKDEPLSAENDPRLDNWLHTTYGLQVAHLFLRQGKHIRLDPEPQFFINLANDKNAPVYKLVQKFNKEAATTRWKTRQETKKLIDDVMIQLKQLFQLPELDLAKKAELLACTKALAEITGASQRDPTRISRLERENLEYILAQWPEAFRQSSQPESFNNPKGIIPRLYKVWNRS
ncbi:hypothetical protein PCANC_05423 [Puccinia coronata f. sp. avenae]|uniref:Uncharacterized protein n=1 Tax=Puccinia coronata f. sp. avenae TaxID=200324 RepID=A0A2N5T6U0_9BASI|nr:hypothetical protein PCANC_05423 [Puccinia coronata f. sp. avenae]